MNLSHKKAKRTLFARFAQMTYITQVRSDNTFHAKSNNNNNLSIFSVLLPPTVHTEILLQCGLRRAGPDYREVLATGPHIRQQTWIHHLQLAV